MTQENTTKDQTKEPRLKFLPGLEGTVWLNATVDGNTYHLCLKHSFPLVKRLGLFGKTFTIAREEDGKNKGED